MRNIFVASSLNCLANRICHLRQKLSCVTSLTSS